MGADLMIDCSTAAAHHALVPCKLSARKRIGNLPRSFGPRQQYPQALHAGGGISFDPWMLRVVGIVGSRQRGTELRANLHQGLRWIGCRRHNSFLLTESVNCHAIGWRRCQDVTPWNAAPARIRVIPVTGATRLR